ncbi:hypothetical protein JOJ88_004751 [Pantoea cypripedii]|nr:hypothetical protein [Pantoea cypripedii]
MGIQIKDITDAMFSSAEGYVFSVIDSIEFSLNRKLTSEECQNVHIIVEEAISKITTILVAGN